MLTLFGPEHPNKPSKTLCFSAENTRLWRSLPFAACGVSFLVCVFARSLVDCEVSVFSCIVCGTRPSPDAPQCPHRHRGPPEQRGAKVRPDPPALRLLSLGACWLPLSLVTGRFLLPHLTSVMRRKGRQGKKHRKKIRIFQSDSVQSHLAPILKAHLIPDSFRNPWVVDVETGGAWGGQLPALQEVEVGRVYNQQIMWHSNFNLNEYLYVCSHKLH